MAELSCDFETYCDLDLKKVGAHKYAMHESADVLCLALAINDEEPRLWIPGDPIPDDVFDHIIDGGAIRAWNAEFERLFFTYVMGPKYGWPTPDRRQFFCTMTEALAMGMPGQLGMCASAMSLPQRKDDVGRRIMMQLCRPRKPTKKNPSTRFTPQNAPGKFSVLYDYCKQDVRVERDIKKNLVRLKANEQERYWLAGEINDRGVPIDLDLIEKAQAVVDQHMKLLDARMAALTNNTVSACTQTKELAKWLGAQGLQWPANELPSVAKDPVFRLLARDDLTDEQREALLLRQEAGKTSTAKLGSFRSHMCDDGTVKGSIQFNGASTGRDAARGVQVQNFPRPNKKTKISQVITDIFDDYDADLISVFHGPPLSIVADILRSCIKAPSGKKFYSCDAAQIEARMTAYLAGEHKVLDAFRAYDRKEGPDIYTVAASGIYNVPAVKIDPEGEQRQAGKVSVLALGFGGGVGAFASMARIYQLDLRKAFSPVWGLASSERREKALDAYAQRGRGSGMHKEAWLASELIKVAWRVDNPNIRDAWPACEEAAVNALKHPGTTHCACKLAFRASGSFLRMVLPSGRSLFFPMARLVYETNQWGKKAPKIYFYAIDAFTRQWMEFSLWGGTTFQNAVQAASRDALFDSVERLEAAGYPNIFRVHDEVINITDEGFGSLAEFRELFIQEPAWAPGLPINGSGWEGERYRK
ncbi:DNA polymerase [Methylocystis hirsuta]|uniref:DNA-directed DNA polymerase n=1 Tax=Methylocystis hirsuta TaxID=369798 RepID=A0A3M9XN51_9HYPH|nr:DNA polymerase [Methylocystis hirsuta]RNJ49424.1 hypothetical protein D1O30_07205 [Methylocystis hirsuta]